MSFDYDCYIDQPVGDVACERSFAERPGTDRQQTQRRKHPRTGCLTTRVSYSNTWQATFGEVKFW